MEKVSGSSEGLAELVLVVSLRWMVHHLVTEQHYSAAKNHKKIHRENGPGYPGKPCRLRPWNFPPRLFLFQILPGRR
ncbi:unnamed protein product, partial [Nesidiocoris tenuis]